MIPYYLITLMTNGNRHENVMFKMLLPFYAFYYSIGVSTSHVTYDVIYRNKRFLDFYKMA